MYWIYTLRKLPSYLGNDLDPQNLFWLSKANLIINVKFM